jgi:hypothetical protein
MQWDREKTLLLIDKYRENTILWDPRHEEHYNKLRRNDAWVELANEMDTDAEACKRKVISLLASLRREKAKMKKSTRTGQGKSNGIVVYFFQCSVRSIFFNWQTESAKTFHSIWLFCNWSWVISEIEERNIYYSFCIIDVHLG